jgi:putative toxin-antitoxin system antitoxin component (TIGR02293 family)
MEAIMGVIKDFHSHHGQGPTEDLRWFRRSLEAGEASSPTYAALLGLRTADGFELRARVEEGLPYSALERFQRNVALPMAEIAELIQIPARTLTRRRESGRLQTDESDRLVRASRIFGEALELFDGDLAAAKAWLSTPQPALGGATPLAMARTGVGAREVEHLIGRLEHGVFS